MSKFIIFRLLLLFTLISILQCTGKRKETVKDQIESDPQYEQFETGKILNHITCIVDTNESFALYLPKNYRTNQAYPVIYAFDASARGSYALKKYAALAEKYSYILVGSNNSRNGLEWNEIQNTISILFKDTRQRISINQKRIYTAGFSGGARVATSAAMENPGICGVMSCAAGFPSMDKPMTNYFNYAGMVGNEDFNYNELQEVEKALGNFPMRHILLTFNGKHDWAPAEIFEEAFLFNEFNAMKDKLIPVNDSLIKKFSTDIEKKIKSLANTYEQYLEYHKLVVFLDGLTDISEYREKMESLQKSPDYKNIAIHIEKLAAKESGLQSENMDALTKKNMDWWKVEISGLKNQSKFGDVYKKEMYKRVLSHLGLLTHMSYDNALKNNSEELAYYFLQLKELVQPEEPIVYYLYASFFARNDQIEKSLSFLDKAVNMGFDDVYRITTDANFNTLRSNPKFIELSQRIEMNGQ